MKGQPIEIRTLALVLAAVALLFAVTKLLSRWYAEQRRERAEAQFRRGSEMARAGRHEQAIEGYRNALAAGRDSTRYRLALAQSLMALGRRSEASLHLQEVLRADPAAALPNLLLARIATAEGRTDAAIGYYQRAIFSYWPSEAEANRVEARWELVSLLAAAGQPKRVVAELLELADAARDDAAAQRRVATLLLEYNAPMQAAEIIREALRGAPRDVEARTLAGRAELALGNYQRARDAFRRALLYDPHNKAAREELAVVTDALSLDPTVRGIASGERLRRSRELASRALQALEACLKERIVPPETATLVEEARQALSRKSADRAKAVEINLSVAEQLWQHRTEFCRTRPADEPLARVLARISK